MSRWGKCGAGLAVTALGLTACELGTGEAAFVVQGAEEAFVTGPEVVCRPPGDGGETVTPTWEWSGEIGGEAATLSFAGVWDPATVDSGALVVGERRYVAFDQPGGDLVRQHAIDDEGMLLVEATLPLVAAGDGDVPADTVEIQAALRCPTWPVEALDTSSSRE